ncbi:hypothetical protein [Cellulomonas sp. ICMP 17802]|uniref:hypothetical protein n=1 Tax=Cellulomonas sp. ICMP 17802 TaxID=3239199 RepID=UPI00351B1DDD
MVQPHPATTAARDWLTHPVTCVALVVLVVNDHLLKAALGTWWTGKLSDVAWLVVVPPLVAVAVSGLARVVDAGEPSAARCAWTSTALVGVVFAVVKTTSPAAHLASSVLGAVAGPSRVLADPTDLLALPALALAWHVGRVTRTRARRRPRRELRWLVVLPLVVLATAATSSISDPPDGAMQVGVVDGVLVVGMATDLDLTTTSWYVSEDGEEWRYLREQWTADATTDAFVAAGGSLGTTCAAPTGSECYQVAAEGVGVSRSADGGDTWEVDWAVPPDVLRALATRYDPDGQPLRTHGVAILPTQDGYRVYAANGGDGLAVRDEHGTWTRIGFPWGADDVEPLPLVPPPDAHPLPVGATLVVPATLALLVLSRRRRRGRASSAVWTGRCLAAAAGVLAVIALRTNLRWGPIGGQWVQVDGAPGAFEEVLVLAALVVSSTVLAAVGVGLLRRRAGWLVAAGAVGVATVLELVSPPPLAALTAATLLAAGVAAVRRASRPGELPLE